MTRKTVLFFIIVLFVIGLGFIGYYFFFNDSQTTGDPVFGNNQVENPFGNFFPTENTPTQNTPEQPNTVTETNNSQFQGQVPKLRKISSVPVAGATIFERKATSTNLIINEEGEEGEEEDIIEVVYRYIERATGHVFETTSHNLTTKRISNTTIPKIYEAFFLNNKDQFVMRYLDEDENIETYVATIRPVDSTEENRNETFLDGVFLQKNISKIIPSPTGNSLFLLADNPNAASDSTTVGYIAPSTAPQDQDLVFNSPLSEWKAEWVSNDEIFLNTKPSSFASGFLYEINVNTGGFDKVLGPERGMMSKVSPDNTKIIFSTINGSRVETKIEDLEADTLRNFKVDTLAEKCVWNETSTAVYCAVPNIFFDVSYPDYWYLGIVSFNDSLAKLDIENGNLEVIMPNNSEVAENLDMINLQISPSEDFLLFTNKIDLSLWSLDLK